jgi:DNA-binding NarL/FixJ family response regulator
MDESAFNLSRGANRGGIKLDQARVLLADDHPEMMEEVRNLLRRNYEIVGGANNGEELVEAAQRLKPDLIISDISMPVMTGFEAATKIRASGVPTKLIFLTVQSSPAYLKKALALGADGYVLKVYSNGQLPEAVSQVLAGGQFFSPQLRLETKKIKPSQL